MGLLLREVPLEADEVEDEDDRDAAAVEADEEEEEEELEEKLSSRPYCCGAA